MVTDWYNKYLGTEYEASGLPWLYNKYIGHDNNRDAMTMNMKESQYVGRLLFTEWKPQAYFDFHHMGSYGARIFFPPYAEPIRPLADPLVWRESAWYGAEMANRAEEAGLSGVMNDGQYSGWGHFGFHWITPFHNIAGMLTESASARLATPLYIDPSQLTGGARNLQRPRSEQMNFPNPWPGGWWTLRGIVDRQKVGAWALLDCVARNAETIVWDTYLKATRQTERGAAGKPAAYAISATQHDRLTRDSLDQCAARPGHRGAAVGQGLRDAGRHGLSARLVLRLRRAAEDGAHSLPARRDPLPGQRVDAPAGRDAHPAVRHGPGRARRIHGHQGRSAR